MRATDSTVMRDTIRRTLREKRQQLSTTQQQQAAQAIVTLVTRSPYWQRAQHIAFYIAQQGELDPCWLQQQAEQEGKQCYAPIVQHPQRTLTFAAYTRNSQWTVNRFGIAEPISADHYSAQHLDLVLLPLVGFDRQGHRLGMGSGYYDRTFAHRPPLTLCCLLGLAYAWQEVSGITPESWDVALHGIATDQELIMV